MRVFFFGNNWLGWQALRVIREAGDVIVGAALHPPALRTFEAEILSTAGLSGDQVLDASKLDRPDIVERVRELTPDLGLSVMLKYILRKPLLEAFPSGCINLHPSLLPYNRGVNPNVWSIVDQTPAGVSLHYIDPGVDTGDLIAQAPVVVEPIDTGETLYRKLESAALSLFRQEWSRLRNGTASRIPQPNCGDRPHRYRDLDRLDWIDPDQQYSARHLIDILRARTFPPYRGAYTRIDGRKVYLRLQLEFDDSESTPVVMPIHGDQSGELTK